MTQSKAGVLEGVFERLQRSEVVFTKIEGVFMGRTIRMVVHPVGIGARPRIGPQLIGKACGVEAKNCVGAADARTAVIFSIPLSSEQAVRAGYLAGRTMRVRYETVWLSPLLGIDVAAMST